MAKGNPQPKMLTQEQRLKGARKKGKPKAKFVSRPQLDAMAKRNVHHSAARIANMQNLAYSTPLEYMIHVLLDKNSSQSNKRWAAQAAAPYIHRRMPIAIEGGDPTKPLVLATLQQLANLTPEQLRVLQGVSAAIESNQGDIMKLIGATIVKAGAIEDLEEEPPTEDYEDE
jgi:hypothetical protein